MNTFSNILGAAILIAIILPWFLIAFFVVSIAYVWAAIFYRASARELKVRYVSVVFSYSSLTKSIPAAAGFNPSFVTLQPLLGVFVGFGHYSCVWRNRSLFG